MQQDYKSLSQQELRNLYNTSGAILLLDIPEGLQFGIDNILWKVGEKFKGIKFIPFGPHIITYTLKDENNQFKINKFLYLDQSKLLETQVLILKWSTKYSIFLQLKGSQAQGYRQGVRNYHFDSYLGPYPSENVQFWKQNSSMISRAVMQKLEPVQKIYKFQEEYSKIKENKTQEVRIDVDEEDQEILDEKEQPQNMFKQELMDEQKISPSDSKEPNVNPSHKQNLSKKFQPLSDTIYYSQIPRLLTNDPTQISKVNLNKTPILIQIIHKQYLTHSLLNSPHLSSTTKEKNKQAESKILAILGQLQYSFIYFLIGQDQESFQQWKKLINLFIFAEDIFQTKQSINMKKEDLSLGNKQSQLIIDMFQQIALQFIVVLYNQLKQFPVDFFIDELSKNSFMQHCLKRLQQYRDQQEGMISKKVKKRLQKLFKLLSTKFNYELKQETDSYDEDAPIVVQEDQNYF